MKLINFENRDNPANCHRLFVETGTPLVISSPLIGRLIFLVLMLVKFDC